MEYMVMECHLSYAVVMDQQGRFQKVANLGYEVGQELDHVVAMRDPRQRDPEPRRFAPVLTVAACLCLVVLGVWQMWLLSMGTVLIQINPQIRLSVNRLERVISAEAVNADGARVLFDYDPYGKPVEQVARELGDRAADLGYLPDGGEVRLTVESGNAQWKTETEQRLASVAVTHARDITVWIGDPQPGDDDWDDDWDDDPDDEDDEDDEDPTEDTCKGEQHRQQEHQHGRDDDDDDEEDDD